MHDELGDAVTAKHLEGFAGVGVDEHDPQLVAVAAVDEPGRVQARDAVAQREPAARQHEARVAVRQRKSDPGRHQRPPTARRKHGAIARNQVAPGIAWVRVRRQRQVGIETHDGDLEHGANSRFEPVLVWMDLEMTGLDPARHVIVEIATLVTDDELEVVAEGPDLVVHATDVELSRMDDVVVAMHTSSGLIDQIKASTCSLAEAGAATLAFIKEHAPEARSVPLCGNSIGTDRRFLATQLPEIEDWLHYRSVDVSTVKELARRWYPGTIGGAPKKDGSHRALDDIRESVAELRYYRETVFARGARPPGA